MQLSQFLPQIFGCKKETDEGSYYYIPYFSWSLNILITLVALFTFDFWSIEDKASINMHIMTTYALTVTKGYSLAFFLLFIYHVLLYFFIHLVYSTLLIQYYLYRAECRLGWRRTFLIYMANAVLAPIFAFYFIIVIANVFHPEWAVYTSSIMVTKWYVGPSIAIWGVAGFMMYHERKNPFYWAGFFAIIGVAVFLKLLGLRSNMDWSSDIAHLTAFFFSAAIGYFYLKRHQSEILCPRVLISKYSLNYYLAGISALVLLYFSLRPFLA